MKTSEANDRLPKPLVRSRLFKRSHLGLLALLLLVGGGVGGWRIFTPAGNSALREMLIQYATDTKDHTVSDTFV